MCAAAISPTKKNSIKPWRTGAYLCPQNPNPVKRILLFLLLLGLAVGGYFGFVKYQIYTAPNVPDELSATFVHIPSGATFDQVVDTLLQNGQLLDADGFREVAAQLKYVRTPMRAGRFAIEPGWSNLKLVRHLRGGAQAPVKVVLTNARFVEEVAGDVARQIEADSAAIMALLSDPAYLDTLGLDPATALTLFIPNTYELYWNTSAGGFVDRMRKEHTRFWGSEERLAKAEAANLSPEEVYTLAAIVQKETNQNAEKPRVAGVYLNRLERGIPLQADPTVVYALRQFDLRRVLFRHLEVDSPYNTYKNAGLPPGPIAMADISSIDAVLDPEAHDYLYFVARGDESGRHNFSKTLAGHNANIRTYQQNLRRRGLR